METKQLDDQQWAKPRTGPWVFSSRCYWDEGSQGVSTHSVVCFCAAGKITKSCTVWTLMVDWVLTWHLIVARALVGMFICLTVEVVNRGCENQTGTHGENTCKCLTEDELNLQTAVGVWKYALMIRFATLAKEQQERKGKKKKSHSQENCSKSENNCE